MTDDTADTAGRRTQASTTWWANELPACLRKSVEDSCKKARCEPLGNTQWMGRYGTRCDSGKIRLQISSSLHASLQDWQTNTTARCLPDTAAFLTNMINDSGFRNFFQACVISRESMEGSRVSLSFLKHLIRERLQLPVLTEADAVFSQKKEYYSMRVAYSHTTFCLLGECKWFFFPNVLL